MESMIIDWEAEYRELQDKYLTTEKMQMYLEKRCKVLEDRVKELESEKEVAVDIGQCESCGKNFETSHLGRVRKYCSARCRQADYRIRLLFKS